MAVSVSSNSTYHTQLCLWLARLVSSYLELHRAGNGDLAPRLPCPALPRPPRPTLRHHATTATTTARVVRSVMNLLLLCSPLEDSSSAGGEGLALGVS
jgi:hypothetical protein